MSETTRFVLPHTSPGEETFAVIVDEGRKTVTLRRYLHDRWARGTRVGMTLAGPAGGHLGNVFLTAPLLRALAAACTETADMLDAEAAEMLDDEADDIDAEAMADWATLPVGDVPGIDPFRSVARPAGCATHS